MRHFIKIFVIAIIAMFNFSCTKMVPSETIDNEIYTVSLGWDGDLDVTYEPLTRSLDDNPDLYGIQVYSTKNHPHPKEDVIWEPYAYGLFDNSSAITINLLKGYKYKFVATMVENGKNIIGYLDSRYCHPFFVNNTDKGQMKLENNFTYSTLSAMSGINSGEARLKDGVKYSVPNTKRYYGVLESYEPTKHNATAKIKMKTVSFGAKFVVNGKLAEAGVLEVQIEGAPKSSGDITKQDNQLYNVYTFTDVENAWLNAAHSQTNSVTINWRTLDDTVIPLGTHEMKFKRNATTVVKINIDNNGLDSGLGIEIEDEGEMADDEEVTIQDGEVVETDVELQK